LLTSDDIYCYILKLYKYFKVFRNFLSTHIHINNIYVKQTASKDKFIINIMTLWKIINICYHQKQEQQDRFEKDDNKNNMKQEQKSKEVITTSTVFNNVTWISQIFCKEVLLYTRPGKLCWVGTPNKFSNLIPSINKKYFCQKLINSHFVVNELSDIKI